MAKFGTVAAALAAGLLAAQPCAAQNVNAMQFERPASAFAGVSLRVAFDSASRPKPLVRLQFTADPGSSDGTNPGPDFKPRGLEIALLDTGKPALFVNGRSAAEARDQFDLGGAGGTALIVGGVLIGVLVIALAAGGAGLGDTCPTIEGSRDHCINP